MKTDKNMFRYMLGWLLFVFTIHGAAQTYPMILDHHGKLA